MYDKDINIKFDVALGYYYFIDRSHPLASGESGKVYYHRHVASLKFKRWLKREECVHHLDGNKKNNSPENLVICSRSSHGKEHHTGCELEEEKCKKCGKTFLKHPNRDAKFCSRKCADKSHRIFDISKEKLQKLVWEYPTVKVAKMLGVSDSAIGKRCKKLGVKKPPRGYWAKRSSSCLRRK